MVDGPPRLSAAGSALKAAQNAPGARLEPKEYLQTGPVKGREQRFCRLFLRGQRHRAGQASVWAVGCAFTWGRSHEGPDRDDRKGWIGCRRPGSLHLSSHKGFAPGVCLFAEAGQGWVGGRDSEEVPQGQLRPPASGTGQILQDGLAYLIREMPVFSCFLVGCRTIAEAGPVGQVAELVQLVPAGVPLS